MVFSPTNYHGHQNMTLRVDWKGFWAYCDNSEGECHLNY